MAIGPEFNVINGTPGDDDITGTDGKDYIDGQAGNDILNGGDRNDIVHGREGDDQVYGGAGRDRVWGGSGNDWTEAGDGADLLAGGRGSDVMAGGNGADRFMFDSSDVKGGDIDNVVDFDRSEGDKIDFRIFTLDNANIRDAFANVGTDVGVREPGERPFRLETFRVDYLEGPASASAAGLTANNDPTMMDTRLTFTLGNGQQHVIWVWNTELRPGDIV